MEGLRLTGDGRGFRSVFVDVHVSLVFHAADPQLSSGGRAELGEIGAGREHFGATQLSTTKLKCYRLMGRYRGGGG